MSKIKVLVVPSDRSGVGKFRSVDPHIFLQNNYSDEFHVDIDFNPPMEDMNFWKNYQIVHYHRSITGDFVKSNILVEKLKDMGVVTIETLESDRLRIGWLGGSSHLADIQLLNTSFAKLSQNKNDLQFVLCGFDVRGTVTEINGQTGEHVKRNIKPEETVWARYEEIFTQKYQYVSDNFKKELLTFTQSEHNDFSNESYRRVWTLPVTSYAKNYAKFDVSLAPIKNHIFNRMKSQLKVIEAGFYKKALIASNLGPYTIDLKHCLKNGEYVDGNAMLVDETRNHGDWAKYIQKLLKNKNLVTDMGERLYETVKDTYDLNVVTKTRSEFYKSILK
jgi:glycosyltransferase involved in cell wall biosynthesis